MLEEFGPSIYVAEGPTVSFFGFPYPTRMALARLSDASLWAWSPVALTAELEREVEAIGPVRHIVSPNTLHHLFLRQWAERWPQARLHALGRGRDRRPGLALDLARPRAHGSVRRHEIQVGVPWSRRNRPRVSLPMRRLSPRPYRGPACQLIDTTERLSAKLNQPLSMS